MNVAEVLAALGAGRDPDFPVVVMRRDRDRLLAAPALGVALDEDSEDVALMGDFSDEDDAVDDAASIGEIRDAFEQLSSDRVQWSVFSTALDDPTGGGSLVGHSVDDEIEIFAFLQGPRSDWDD